MAPFSFFRYFSCMNYVKLIFLISLISFSYCKSDSSATDPSSTNLSVRKDITVDEANKWLRTDKDVILIDVRTIAEYQEGYIDGATLIDYKADYFEKGINQLDKNATYLMYCQSGNRSGKATDYMISQGFNDVTNMKGGYSEWKEKFL